MASETFNPNFCFPYRMLENERVKLVPFIPSKHAERFIAASKDHPDTYKYLPYGPFDNASALLDQFIFKRIQPNRENILYTVFNKEATEDPEILAAAKGTAQDGDQIEDAEYAIAGVTGFLNTLPEHLKTEIGFVFVLPKFQKTHVTANMVGLMLEFCFAPAPTDSSSDPTQTRTWGLGLRRVQWQANALNTASIRAAERMGFVREGTLRWDRVLSPGKSGSLKNTAAAPCPEKPGRDTAILSICWDEWEEKRGAVGERMERRV